MNYALLGFSRTYEIIDDKRAVMFEMHTSPVKPDEQPGLIYSPNNCGG